MIYAIEPAFETHPDSFYFGSVLFDKFRLNRYRTRTILVVALSLFISMHPSPFDRSFGHISSPEHCSVADEVMGAVRKAPVTY